MNPKQQYDESILKLSAQALAHLYETEPSLASQTRARNFVLNIQRLALDQQKPLDEKPAA